MRNVRIGQVTLFGGMPPSGEGFIVDPDGFGGWEDGVDIRRDSTSRAQAHGDFDIPGFLDSRTMSFSGNCIANTPEKLAWFRSQLTGLLADGNSGRVVVEHAGSTMWTDARLASMTKFATSAADPTTARFQVQLWAANPRLFGESRSFASGVPAFHFGNFPAEPVHVVSGSMANGYRITGPAGKQFSVLVPVVAGQPHTIDMSAEGLLEVNGVVVTGGVNVADLWSVPPGAQVVNTLVPYSGSGTLATTVRDTFV